ncbi:thiamine phosphate synthase [Helicobacter mastomyrinus]|uniref:Thiamine phosphate synthase n=1 Tax=Helicobacter mastomyrinus TaxID=287948 RepID=A0ABZ3F8W7_9HELI
MRAWLITPHIDERYISTLALYLPTIAVDGIICRTQNKKWLNEFVKYISPLSKILLLNLPFNSLLETISLSASFQGVHLKSHLMNYITPLKNAYLEEFAEQKIIGYSAHSIAEVESALALGADYCTLSPIFPTPNKGTPLGLETLNKIPYTIRSRVIALGGINHTHIPILKTLGLGGYAGIRCFLESKR